MKRVIKQGATVLTIESGSEPSWLLDPPGTDYITDHIYGAEGAWERELVDYAIILMPENGTLVDVGANIGSWTIPFGRHLERFGGKVIAFEPLRRSFYQLCGNIFLNGLEGACRAYEVALGDKPDTGAEIYLPDPRSQGGATLLAAWGGKEHANIERVTLKRLDDYAIRCPDILKVDVEGFELEVLKGAKQTLARAHPHIFFESWDAEWRGEKAHALREELFTFIRKLGYQINQLSREDFLAHHPSRGGHIPPYRP